MKILIADDESLARKRILKLLKDVEIADMVLEASSGKETIQIINESKPDLIFLDIQMTDMTGFDVLKKIDSVVMPIIIFVTAYDNFAVQAFEVQAIDFLLKPYTKERFFDALYRGIDNIRLKEKKSFKLKVNKLIQFLENDEFDLEARNNRYLEKIVLKLGKKYYFIAIDRIKYITSSAYYAEIYTKENAKHLYRISMSDFIKKLDPTHFIRVNRSTIINIDEVKEVISEGLGDYSIIMNDDTYFTLTKNFKKPFLGITNIK